LSIILVTYCSVGRIWFKVGDNIVPVSNTDLALGTA